MHKSTMLILPFLLSWACDDTSEQTARADASAPLEDSGTGGELDAAANVDAHTEQPPTRDATLDSGPDSEVADAANATDASPADAAPPGCDPQLTYASFGQAFAAQYCARSDCHDSETMQAGFDFGLQQTFRANAAQVRAMAVTSTQMPAAPPFPSAEQRAELGEWLRCGAP